MSNSFARLIDWYSRQCNGDWEHQHGFEIQTLDNPGVRLRVDLNGTSLEKSEFSRIEYQYDSDTEWIVCEKTADKFFDGCCAIGMSEQMIGIFVNWAEGGEGGTQLPPVRLSPD